MTPISLLPPRASSFHRKSGSTGGLTMSSQSQTPQIKQHKISLDNLPRTTVTPVAQTTSEPVPSISIQSEPAITKPVETPKLKNISLSSSSDEDDEQCEVFSVKSNETLEINSSEDDQKQKTRSCVNTPIRRPRAPPRRSRTIAGDSDLIRPGKVAEILHRFSSTNRGAIRSVYYDSNSDSETSSAIWLQTTDEDDEVDHLSRLLDQTLDDLDDCDFDTE